MFSISKERDLFVNEQIRAKEVMVIGPNGEQLGVKPIKDALTLANYAGFDLVLINQNSNPQVCKIMDYNKFKYENKKRQKENLKKCLLWIMLKLIHFFLLLHLLNLCFLIEYNRFHYKIMN